MTIGGHRLLAARSRRPTSPCFVSKDRPAISAIDLTSTDFPIVRSNLSSLETPDASPANLDSVLGEFDIVGDHPSIRKALEVGATLAASPVPIILLGETGTGKELFGRFIHRLSGRPKDRFIPVNCAAIPGELIESFLSAHKKGSITGAIAEQIGKFDLAHEGTIFLDELGELSLAAQAKLLRVLQDGMIQPLGAKRVYKVDVRIIAATNRDLRRSIQRGRFREDLYYRLSVGEIQLPAMRERKSDIPKSPCMS